MMWFVSRTAWNLLIISVALCGSGLIWATRIQPGTDQSQPVVSAQVAQPDSAAEPLPDHPAPDFILTDVRGASVQLESLKGQVVLINVWATWCPPCRAEMPAIQAAYSQYHDQGFTVLAVNLQESSQAVSAFMEAYELTFPALLDTDGRVSILYRARVLPSSFFVDRQGIIRAVYRGPMPRGIITGTVEQLLREKL